MRSTIIGIFLFIALGFFTACSNHAEVERADVGALQSQAEKELFENTVYKPGPPQYTIGKNGGEIVVSVYSDPKTFNIINTRDGTTSSIIGFSYDTLADYDPYAREFIPRLATFTIQRDTAKRETYVTYTLIDTLYWRTASGDKVSVTADDIVFWFDEIIGNPSYDMGYSLYFITTKNKEKKRITITKISDKTVRFTVPELIANPVYYTNMSFGPMYKYKNLVEKIQAQNSKKDYRDIFTLDSDPKDFPSVTGFVMSEYRPGQYIQYTAIDDDDYWEKDAQGYGLPYIESVTFKIIKSDSTQALLFKQGELSAVSLQISQLSDMISSLKKGTPPNGVVYNRGTNIGSSFITFNQNTNSNRYSQKWFVKKKFRQAMSRLLPRQKIADQVYNGLATPARYLFAKPNAFFDETISLPYTYNPQKAVGLLKQAGFLYKDDGLLYDEAGEHVKFSLAFGGGVQSVSAIAGLFQEELKNVGITLDIKEMDFQLLVENITKTYQWDAIMVYLGSNYFPESNAALWLSDGINHLWNPSQKTPATTWEKRVDELYYKGLYTLDYEQRKKIYDEYQQILLENVPLFYIVNSYSFLAAKKNIRNVFVDAVNSSILEHVNYLYIE